MSFCKKFFKFNNKRGLTIIELLVSVGLLSIVSLGVMSVISNMQAEQNKAMLLNTLKSLKIQMQYLIRDPNSWSQTINYTHGSIPYNNSARFNSLRAKTAVDISAVPYGTPEKIILFNQIAEPSETFNLLGPSDSTGNGFTLDGAKCDTFNTAGNDACPISYRLLVGFDCLGTSTSCINPQMRVVARLVFSPSSNRLMRLKGILSEKSGSDISNANNLGRYDVLIDKVPNVGNRSFTIASNFISSSLSDDCSTSYNGAGQCTTTFTTHPLTTAAHPSANGGGWTFVSGASTLVTLGTTSRQHIRFNEPGNYSCTISVPAFATGGFVAQLYNETATRIVGEGSTVAGKWSQSAAVIETKFSVSQTGVTDNYVIYQKCDNANPGTEPPTYPASQNSCTLGKMTGSQKGTSGTPVTTTIISATCYKLDSM